MPLWTNISSQPVSYFTLTEVQTNHAGNYRVVVRNAANSQPGVPSNLAALTLLPDTDDDGLPDEWETAHGLDPANFNDAASDLDGDGVSNLNEYFAGTDERDPRSVLRIEGITRDSATSWRLQFVAASNRTYSVQACDDPGLGSGWYSAADVVATATNRLVEIVRPLDGVTGKFLRLTTPRTR